MASNKYKILKYKDGTGRPLLDSLAIEEPLQISISGPFLKTNSTKNIAVTMRTPGADHELAVGFLYGEGLLDSCDKIKDITIDQNKIELELNDSKVNWENLQRNFYTSSSCGVCGKASIESISINKEIPTPMNSIKVSPSLIYSLPLVARDNQNFFHETGGIHAATLFDTEGKILIQYEDVGRHNALDKVIGHGFMKDALPFEGQILLLSGRASFELMQKSIVAGIQVVVAIGAPSSLAVELAEEYDLTLVGFLKEDSFNVYSAAHRIQ